MIIKGNKLTEKVPLKFHKPFVNIIYYRLFLQDSYLQLKNKIFGGSGSQGNSLTFRTVKFTI